MPSSTSAVAAFVSITLTGCSWIFVKKPPDRADASRPVECTESAAAPTADTLVAVLSGTNALVGSLVLAATSADTCSPGFAGLGCALGRDLARSYALVAALSGVAGAVLYGLSARTGFDRIERCRALKASTRAGGVLSLERDVDRPSTDYRGFAMDAPDPDTCRDACAREARCKAFTYVHPDFRGPTAFCFLKEVVPRPFENRCCISGVK